MMNQRIKMIKTMAMIKNLSIKKQLYKVVIWSGGLLASFIILLFITLFIFDNFYLNGKKSAYLEEYCKKFDTETMTRNDIRNDLQNFFIEDLLVEESYKDGKLIRYYRDPTYLKEEFKKQMSQEVRGFSVSATNKIFDFKICSGVYEISSGKIQEIQFIAD